MQPIDRLTVRHLQSMQLKVKAVKHHLLQPEALCDFMVQSYLPETEAKLTTHENENQNEKEKEEENKISKGDGIEEDDDVVDERHPVSQKRWQLFATRLSEDALRPIL